MSAAEQPAIPPPCPVCLRLARRLFEAADASRRLAPVTRQAPESTAAVLAQLADYTATMQMHCDEEHPTSGLLMPADAVG